MRVLFWIGIAGFLFYIEKASGCNLPPRALIMFNKDDSLSGVLLSYPTSSSRPITKLEFKSNITEFEKALEFIVEGPENNIITILTTDTYYDLLDSQRPDNRLFTAYPENSEGLQITYDGDSSALPPCPVTLTLVDTNNQSPQFSRSQEIDIDIPPTWNVEIPLNYKLENQLIAEDRDFEKGNLFIETSDPAIRGVATSRNEAFRPPAYQYDVQLFLTDVKNASYVITPSDGVNEGNPITVNVVVLYQNIYSPQFKNTKYFHVFEKKPDPGDNIPIEFEAYDGDGDDLDISITGSLVEYNPDDNTLNLKGTADDYTGVETVTITASEKGSTSSLQSTDVKLVLHFGEETKSSPAFSDPYYFSELSENPSAGTPSVKIDATIESSEELTYSLSDESLLSIDPSSGQLTFNRDVTEEDNFGTINNVLILVATAAVSGDNTRKADVTIVITFPITPTTTTTTTTPPTTTGTTPCEGEDCETTCPPCPTTTTITTPSPSPTVPCDEDDEDCVTTPPTCPPTETPPPCDCTTTTGITGSSTDPTTTEGTGSTCPPTDCSSCPTSTTSSGSTTTSSSSDSTTSSGSTPSSPCTTFDTSSISSSSVTSSGGTCPPCVTDPPDCDPDSSCTPCDDDDDDDKDCSNVGFMVAIIVVSVLCLLLIGAALYLLWLFRKPKSDATTQTQSMDDFSPPSAFVFNEPSNKRFSFGHVSLEAAAESEPGYSNPRFPTETPASSTHYSSVLDPEPVPLPTSTLSFRGSIPSSTPVDALYSVPTKKSNLKSPKDIEPDYEEKPGPVVTPAVQPTKKISDVREPRVLFAQKDEVKVIEDPAVARNEENELSDSDGDYERL